MEERLRALEKDQEKAFALFDQQLEFFNAPLLLGIAGDYLEALGDREKAKTYFERAAGQSDVVSHRLWHHLKNIEQKEPAALANEVETLRDIRTALPQLKLAIGTDTVGDGFTLPPEEVFGTPEQIHALDALSWGLLHDALLAQEKPDLEAIEKLTGERRALAQARIEEASEMEALLHLKNMERQAVLDATAGGRIEAALRNDGREGALAKFDQLKRDVRVLERMVHRHRSATGKDPFSEGLAGLNWRLHFDGRLSLDRPQEALQSLSRDVIPGYRFNETTAWHLKKLQKQFPHLFDACGAFDPRVDMSETELGRLAASRTRSAYWISNDPVREIGIPLGGGIGGAALGFGVANLPGAMVGGGAGALLGLGGNTVYNVLRPEAVTAYRQSLRTGLSQTDERGAYLNKTFWGWSAGFSALGGIFWASPVAVGTNATIHAARAAVRQAAMQGGWRAVARAGSQRALLTLRRPDQIWARTTAAAQNGLAGGIHLAQRLATREAFESGAVQVGRFLQGSFKNIPGGLKGFAARGGAGVILVGADLAYFGEPWYIDHFTGSLGSAIFISEGASYLYRINANGLLVANLARVATEWAMQIQQDMPISQPDPYRLMWASAETATMVFFAKSLVRGSEFLDKFPVGQLLLRGHKAMTRRFPAIQPVLTSITARGTPRFVGLKGEEIKPGNGNGNGHGVTLSKQRIVRLPNEREFNIGKTHKHRDELHRFGITVEGSGRKRRLIAWRPEYRHEAELGGRKISYRDPIDDATEQKLWRLGIRRNERNRFLMQRHTGVKYTGAKQTNGNGYRPTFDEQFENVEMETVTVGAKRFPVWRGVSRSRPRFSILGAHLVAAQTGMAAWGVNKAVFSKQMRGDTEYQPRQRTVNYIVSDLFTHPFLQWPLGYDKWKAELVGRLVGLPVNLGANLFFRTYRDQWPGQETYLAALDRSNYLNAFENIQDNMTTLAVLPRLTGELTRDFWYWEVPALKEYRKVHNQIIVDRDVRRIRHLANTFSLKAEQERIGDLSTVDRRTLRIEAAYFNSVLVRDPHRKIREMEPLRQIQGDYPMLFKNLPNLESDQDWEYFIGQVNRETDPAHDFHLYLK